MAASSDKAAGGTIRNFHVTPGGLAETSLPPSFVDTPRLYAALSTIAAGALEKEPEQLTERERVAICAVAGVPMQIGLTGENEMLTITTTARCGITKTDGRWEVMMTEPL